MNGQVRMVDARTAQQWLARDRVVIVDVREPEEWRQCHIPGAHLVPLSSFDPARVPKVGDGKALLLHCRSAVRCGVAAEWLVASGYQGEINRLTGGLAAWVAAGGPVE